MFRRFVIISSIAVALAGTTALAASVQKRESRNRDPFARADLSRIQQRLNLTEVQVNGIRALQENRRKDMESLQQEVHQKRQALRELERQPNPNPADVGNASLALQDVRNRTKDINQRFLSGVKGLLTPDQLQKLPKRFQ